MKQFYLTAPIVVLAGFSLAGCEPQEAAAPAQPTEAVANAQAPVAADGPGFSVANARVQLPVIAGRPGAAYLDISRDMAGGKAADWKIASITVEGVGRTEMHETKQKDGVSSMQKAENIPLLEGDEVSFVPGGLHVMLFDVAIPANATSAKITVTVADASEKTTALQADATVTKIAQSGH